ncbi:MAG: hypothetical protein LBU95_01445 [Rikenellaceae bacterium]|jgi:uncharacterized protein YneF (UPF0154 family)|nr:hypothetical protein [Rikenellaceae bacterium]
MSSFLLIVIVAVAVVGLFVLGMSLTLIFKGHHIQSEIGENPEMRKRGIKCTAQAFREEELGLADCDPAIGCGDCANPCATNHDTK